MPINFNDLKKQASRIDTYQFTKFNKSLGGKSKKYTPEQVKEDDLNFDSLAFTGLSKQAKIKLITKNQ